LTTTVRAATQTIERALAVHLSDYRFEGRTFFATRDNPTIPTRLGVQSVVGLDNFAHQVADPVRRFASRDGGYFPLDFRNAYDVTGHGISGLGQTIGLTLWGAPVPNSDFQKLANLSGDPPLLACKGCASPDRIQWVNINGSSTDTSAQDESSMDAEYSHGMALGSHLRFYLGNGGLAGLADAIAAAANDKTLHIVSDSWHISDVRSANNSFVVATNNELMHAVAVGTTFYFSSGDHSNNSGCDQQTEPFCGLAGYPASSPYVVTVGGTNLQVDASLTQWSSESVWSTDPNDGSGGGAGCASYFKRPVWQVGVSTNASCPGRAEPDIAANADPNTGADVVTKGQAGVVGGTSLATPLTAGMAADTNAFLSHLHKPLMGFAAPRIYKLANSKYYNTYFHDVRCGYNGFPAAPGWDEATGWGSQDWYMYSRGFAGLGVPARTPAVTCHQLSNPSQAAIPWDGVIANLIAWPSPAENQAQGTLSPATLDAKNDVFKNFHTRSYTSMGVSTSWVQTEVTGLDPSFTTPFDEPAYVYYLVTKTHSNQQANVVAQDAVATLKRHSIVATPCLHDDGSGNGPDYPDATANCYYTGVSLLGYSGFYGIMQNQNVVAEVLLLVAPKYIPAGSSEESSFQGDSALMMVDAIFVTNDATNTVVPSASSRPRTPMALLTLVRPSGRPSVAFPRTTR
jgi:hypothetical protein